MRVLVRPWQRGDQWGARAVLREGSFSNLWPSFRIALLRPATLGVAALVLTACLATCAGMLVTVLSLLAYVTLIYVGCLTATIYFFYGPNFNDIKQVEYSYFSCPDNHFWVAEVEGEIVGTIAVSRKQSSTETAADSGCSGNQTKAMSVLSEGVQQRVRLTASEGTEDRPTPKVAWLRRMAIKSSFRGHGIAKQLVRTVIDFCRDRGYNVIFLITTEVHQPARALYNSMGFRQKAYRPYKHVGGLVNVWTYEFEMDLTHS